MGPWEPLDADVLKAMFEQMGTKKCALKDTVL